MDAMPTAVMAVDMAAVVMAAVMAVATGVVAVGEGVVAAEAAAADKIAGSARPRQEYGCDLTAITRMVNYKIFKGDASPVATVIKQFPSAALQPDLH
jgi:hypothetical protein